MAGNLFGMFQTVTTAPSAPPRNFLDQIQLYKNGSSVKLYVYDLANATWRVIWMGEMVGTGSTSVTQSATQITINS